jgi:acetyl-CoA C-acetyltransferase
MRPVFLVDARRTPQVKAGADFKDVAAPHLGIGLVRAMIDSAALPSDAVDEVIIGNIGAPPRYSNVGRVIALEAGLDKKTSAYTVHRNCASGMEALSQAFLKISAGRGDVMVAGGVESMSQMPLIYSAEMTELFINLMKAKSMGDKLKALSGFRPPYLSPIIALEQGLTDPFCGLNMGQTAELLAREFGISRQEQDEFALKSHQKAVAAQTSGRFAQEIFPMAVGKNLDKILDQDIGPRADSSLEKLAAMKPYFDRKSGSVTVANSCPITDGGSAVLLASEEACRKFNLKPLARVVDYHFAGLDPERMGMGPLVAMDGLLKRTKMTLEKIDLFEINEAFAAQVIANLKAFKDAKQAARFGVDKAWGEIPLEKLNVNGGGIALGHPVGSTGSRLVVTLMHEMKKRNSKYGIASLCIGGGQGGACLIENV